MYVICIGDSTCDRAASLVQVIDQTAIPVNLREAIITEYGAPTCIDVSLIMVDETLSKPYVPTIKDVVNTHKKCNAKVLPQWKPNVKPKARNRLR